MKSLSELEASARRGDAQAFGQLIEQWDDDLRGLVWSIVRSAPDTDDVMQTAYEKAFESAALFRSDSSMKTWLHSICYRAAIDHVRYEGRRRHETTDQLERRATPRSTSDDAISKSELAVVLEQLEPDVRALLMLTAGLGYSFDETAQIVGLERGTVASRVGRAKKALRELNPSERDAT